MRIGTGIALLALAGLLGAADVVAQEAEDGAPRQQAAPPPADPADVGSIDAIMAAVYDAISGGQGEARDWDRFLSLFVPDARLMPTFVDADTGRPGHVVWTPEEYVEVVGPQLEEGGFFEDEAHRVVEEWGGIAHVFSTYNSYLTAADMEAGEPFQRGINSFQLLHDGERWWVVSILWASERPDRPIPGRYLDAE